MPTPSRMMTLVAFLQAQNCSNLPGSWRHPATALDFLTPEYYQRIARVLEDGKIQLAFFDDRLALPDLYTDHHADAVGAGVRAVKLDPSTVLMAMGMATQRLGLGTTYSTTYFEPYHVARVFATMDLMLRGRVAWNIVTSLNSAEALNFGRDEHMEHDARYDRADEFMDVVMGHWNTWEDDALILDKETGRFADPAKVHRLDHTGTYFRSRGPFSVPRSPQGHPVLIQAGQSGRGRSFAARWAELVFVIYHNLEAGKQQYAEFKAAVTAAGRDPDQVRIAPAVYVCVAESEAAAQEKRAVIEATSRPVDALVLISEVLNYDFSKKGYDEAFSDEELAAFSWHGFRERVVQFSGKKNPTVRDFVEVSGRGTVREHKMFCGTPKSVADQLEEWFTAPACDGFVLAATHMPGAYEDVVRLLVPELQRRGLFQKEYAGPTLRDNLGLPIPRAADWHKTQKATE
ncbi:MAG TPA: LLM class flavin-dependent oxidoreductase [Acetobacteraceae bacterium]|nr:LLM class flavin-dependent oxidoreductase [Acetobacteraceae bacterium]